MIYSSRDLCLMDLKVKGQFDLQLVRPMVYSDISEVVEIERHVTYHPWAHSTFSESLKTGYQCWVIDLNSHVIAYLIQSIFTEESHILNLVVTGSRQGQGFGRGLVRKACTDAAKSGAIKIILEVRPTNLIAKQLYESEGFLVVSCRHNYYRSCDRVEDALVMVRDLEPACVVAK